MKTVMCFGDSITWGQDPATRTRLPYDRRWPGVLQLAMGDRIRVIEEALCDRTTIWDDPYVGGRNGRSMLAPLLESHAPVDVLAIMLGTNDLQLHFHKSAAEVALGVGTLIDLAQKSGYGPDGGAPQILVIAPYRFGDMPPMEQLYFGGKDREAENLAAAIETVADKCGCFFLDSSDVVTAGIDGVHLDAANHAKLATAIGLKLDAILT